MTRLEAARNFQKAMEGRVFVVRVGSHNLDGLEEPRRWTHKERENASKRASGMPEEFER
jgi:hypothetical protein